MTQIFSDELQVLSVFIKNAVNEVVQPRFDRLHTTVDALSDRVGSMETSVSVLSDRVGSMETKVSALSDRVGSMETSVSVLSGKVDILTSKSLNSMVDSGGTIAKVPLISGALPKSEYPRCIYSLLVAENEKLPDDSPNTWNAAKSLELIREYDPGYETDGNENAGSVSKRRKVLAKHLGITPYQLDKAASVL